MPDTMTATRRDTTPDTTMGIRRAARELRKSGRLRRPGSPGLYLRAGFLRRVLTDRRIAGEGAFLAPPSQSRSERRRIGVKRMKRIRKAGLAAGIGAILVTAARISGPGGYGVCKRVGVKLQEPAVHGRGRNPGHASKRNQAGTAVGRGRVEPGKAGGL